VSVGARHGSTRVDMPPPPEDAPLFSEVFERFPDGLVVVDGERRIVARNEALDTLAGLSADVDPPATCCELFGCRRRHTSLEEVCVSEMVRQSAEGLPRTVLELPGGRQGQVSVTATPLDDRARRIIFHVRQAAGGHLQPPTTRKHVPGLLVVQALGPLRVTSTTGPVSGAWISQRAGQLFKFLITNRDRAVPLELIADAVWPQARFGTGNTVRHCIHILRSRLEPDVGKAERSPYIIVENNGYRLNPNLVAVDVDAFERSISSGRRAFANGDRASGVAHLRTAVEMYGGEYLVDEPLAEWTLSERERLREMLSDALRQLATLCPDASKVIDDLERLAELEPFDTEVHRQLIAALVAQGRRSRAVRQYQVFEQRLLRTFRETPSFDLADVALSGPHGEPSRGQSSSRGPGKQREWPRAPLVRDLTSR
jgi:DNA-binding SARP family transcriptional activator